MKKLAALGVGAIAAASIALVAPGVADSSPASALNVVGEPYGRALGILKSQGVKAFFGGAVGSDYPQAECIVSQQKITSGGRMYLHVDCTEAAVLGAQSNAPAGGGGGPSGPTAGGNGVTTVTATPVGPQPGMPVPGA